jgi:hypothetical protein
VSGSAATEVVFGGEPWIFVVEGHAKKLACDKEKGKIRDGTGWAKAQHLHGPEYGILARLCMT